MTREGDVFAMKCRKPERFRRFRSMTGGIGDTDFEHVFGEIDDEGVVHDGLR